jgi:SAM-dependent methyltransferase
VQYHRAVISAIPSQCCRALDVGSGRGQLARKLVEHCDEVVAIDRDEVCAASAGTLADVGPKLTFMHGDIFDQPFPDGSFDFVTVVATLHHLPLRRALERFRVLLRPKGVLAVVGLYRNVTPLDFALAAIAFPVSWAIRLFTGDAVVGAPLCDPQESLRDIRAACDAVLPGGVFRRRFFFRYSFVWSKP